MSDFYLLSVKWTRRGDAAVSFWGPNDRGYMWQVADFGVYSREQIATMPDYYHNGHSTLAVPCAVVATMVEDVKDGPTRVIRAVPYNAANMRKLKRAAATVDLNPEPPQAQIIDLMAALKGSLARHALAAATPSKEGDTNG